MVVATRQLLVLVQTLLRYVEGLWGDEGWHRNGNPFLWWRWLVTYPRTDWLQGRFASPGRDRTGATAVGSAGIGRIAQDAPNRRARSSAFRPAGWECRRRLIVSPPHRGRPVAAIRVPAEDLWTTAAFTGSIRTRLGSRGRSGIQQVAVRGHRPGQQVPLRSLACRPRRMRSAIRLRSYSATAPRICRTNWSWGSSPHGTLHKLDLAAQLPTLRSGESDAHTCEPVGLAL